jgi:undecaprenyl-diphosphatase
LLGSIASEYRLSRGLNRAAQWAWILKVMRVSSRLGDGALWVGLLRPAHAVRQCGNLGGTDHERHGAGLHLIYRRLKSSLVRERPSVRHPGILVAMPPLDRYSFPSGHTLNAVS